MTFRKIKPFIAVFPTRLELQTFAAQNCTRYKIVLSKQIFVVFSKEKKNIYRLLAAAKMPDLLARPH